MAKARTVQHQLSIRDRVKELRRVPAGELRGNVKNWRRHPEGQRSAVSAMLSDIGFAGALLAREKDGGLELLDGHLRADIAADSQVPVLILDLTDAEADKLLATYDPLSAMAVTDSAALLKLLGGIGTDFDQHAELRKLMVDLTSDLAKKETGEQPDDRVDIPGMALQPHEHYDFLVILATTTHEWNVLCDKLGLVPEQRRGRMGTCRAIKADRLLAKLNAPA